MILATTHRRSSLAVLTLTALLAAACAPVGPDFVRPDPQLPDEWSQGHELGLQDTQTELTQWWRVFNDPVLDELVEQALGHNNNLEIAGLGILEARAQLGIATGNLYPQSQFAFGDAAWVSPADNSGVSGNFGQYALGASAAWEMDFWGRFRRGIESADAAYLASIAAYQQARVLLCAAVVDTYTVVRVAQEQLRIAHENVKLQQRSFDIAELLYRKGSDSELDMQQAKTLLLSTQAAIPALEASFRQALNALSVLLGQPPGTLDSHLADGKGIPALPEHIAIGLPADLLRQRPDLRQAELLAMAQNARVGLAEADLYPSFSLTGSIGLSAGGPGDSNFGDLFDLDALSLSIGPSFVWPFLNYGRITNNVRVQDARLQQALINYRETALQAAREVEDATAGYYGFRQQEVILAETVKSALRSNDLSTLRYREGFSDYQRVLDAQQALFSQQQRYVTVQGDSVRSVVALYQALGGGWENPEGRPYVSPATLEVMRERSNWGELTEAAYPDNEN